MFHYFDTITNTRGDSLAGWQVECVQLADGSTVVPIFADENSTPISSISGIADRAVTDENGNFDFYVPSGTYSLRIYNSSGVFQRTQRYLPMYGTDYVERIVSPEDYLGTDTQKLQAALDTGKSVRCTAAAYAVTGALTFKASNQILDLNGATITATGNFNLFNVGSSYQRCAVMNGAVEGAAMTGSAHVLSINNAGRFLMWNMNVYNPLNFAVITKANQVTLQEVWVNNIRGTHGIRWVGDASNRSDVLRLVGLTMSFPDTGIGIDWDGNCHTLQAFGAIIVRPNKGVRISNTAGATGPEFGFFTNLEIDFPVSYGVEILAGESYYFGPQFYCQGSVTASGVYIASGLAADRIQFAGGKIGGNATYGIENNVRVLVSNLVLTGNTTANYLNSDNAILTAPRVEIDSTFLMRRSSGDPVIQFDASDFIGFNRSANDLFFNISGATVLTMAANRIQFAQPPQLPVTTVAGLPAAAVGNRGREYYVSDANATTRLAIVAGGGANFVKVFSNGTNWLIA
jgi:hypothetical protein